MRNAISEINSTLFDNKFELWPHGLFLLIPIIAGSVSGISCPMGDETGSNVKFRPPGWVFGLMWPILYLLLGYSWVCASQKNPYYSIPYILLNTLLVLWIIMYSCKGDKQAGVYVILASLMAAIGCFAVGPIHSKITITPLIAWLVFAMMMNAAEIQESE